MDDNIPVQETKGQAVKRMVEASFSPVQRDSLRVEIVKDNPALTKMRIVRKIPVRTDGGQGSSA